MLIYAPLAHMADNYITNWDSRNPSHDDIVEHLWCELMEMKGDDKAEAYMMRVEDSLDYDFDYHDYHAEWNRGFEASIREW